MMTPLVSVVVPCYNDGRFLEALITNLAAQTFRDFETIIVNDGSTDAATLHVLDGLRGKVRVVDQENRYLPGARNRGFSEARAEFVLPLDCDDRLEPSYLQDTVDALRRAHPDVGFVFTHMRLAGAYDGVYASHFDRFDQLFVNRLPYCMLMRKSAWAAIGGYDETMRDGSEDWEFNVRLAQARYRGIEIDRPLFIYTIRPDGMLLSKTARMQGEVWKQIRARNPSLYRLPALIDCWRDYSLDLRSVMRAMMLLALNKVLPKRLFNAIYFRVIILARKWRHTVPANDSLPGIVRKS